MSTCADMTTYTVLAKRWRHGWELHIDGIGVTQSRSLNDAEVMARDYISLDTGVPPDSFSVEIVPEVGEGLDEESAAARRAVAEADKLQRAAASQSREIALKLSGAGLTGREIAVVLRLSPQRVSQLLAGRQPKVGREAHGRRRARGLPSSGRGRSSPANAPGPRWLAARTWPARRPRCAPTSP